MFWQGIRQPWWIAFVVTWLVVAIILRATGTDPDGAVRLAGVTAAVAAFATWLVVRALARGRATGGEEG